MVSKRNRKLLAEKQLDKRQTYGLRKLSFGVASVALTTFLMGGVAPSVLADSVEIVEEFDGRLLNSDDSERSEKSVADIEEVPAVEEETTEPSISLYANETDETDGDKVDEEGKVDEGIEKDDSEEKPAAEPETEPEEEEETPPVQPDRLGGIKAIEQIADNQFEIEYTTGEKGRMDFYSDNIIRYQVDPSGEFPKFPQDDRKSSRPAKIAVAPLEDFDSIKVNLKQTEKTIQLSTDAIAVELDKKKGTMGLVNKVTGEIVLEEVEPMYIHKGNNAQVSQFLKSDTDSQYFGGGTQNGRFTHKGQSIEITNSNNWVDGGVASPNPFYWSTDGYGILRNTFAVGRYDFEKTIANTVKTTHWEDRFDAFYFVGDKPADIIKSYYEVTGAPVVLPEFAHYQGHLNAYNRDYWVPVKEGTSGAVYFEEKGGWYKEYQPDAFAKLSDAQKKGAFRETLNGDPEDEDFAFTARAVVLRYKDHDMPLGWILVNDGYGAGYGQTDSLKGNIQNLAEFSEWAKQYGIETGLWTQSDLKPVEGLEPLLQRDLISEVRDAGVSILKTDVAWVGQGYSFGLNGTEEAKEIMKEYGDDARPFIITLDGWAGTQRNGGIWTGDQYGGNWEYIRFHIPTYIGTSLSGQPNVGSDMDGIFSGANPIINTRDYQWKAFTTLELNMDGWGYNPKNPFAFDQSTTDLNRAYLKLKSMLLPYAYSSSHEALDGMPPIRAMFLDFPDEAINYTTDVQYQYMYGDSLLIAPIYEATAKSDAKGNDVRNGIVLPAGENWIDLYTGDVYEGGQILNNYDAPIWKLPAFVRQGAIIPINNPNNNVTEIDRTTRTVEFYPGPKDTSFILTEDDGLTNAYMEGQIAMTEITSKTAEDGSVILTIGKTDSNYDGYDAVKNKKAQFNVNMTAAPESLKLLIDGEEVELTRAETREAYEKAIENGENVYFYDETPNLNQFSTEGSDFYGKEVIKNPVLHVMTTAFDTTQADAQLIITGYKYEQDKFAALGEETGEAPVFTINDEKDVQPTQIKISWDAVEDADRYELKVDGQYYTNITENSFTHRDLNYLSEHTYQVRAVRTDNTVTPWSEVVTKTTPDNPYKNTISGFTVSVDRPVEGSEPLKNLVDRNENTRYHSKWGQNAIPQKMIFSFNKVWTFDKFEYVPRPDGGNGTIQEGVLEHSMDGVNWTPFEAKVQWDATGERQYYDLGGIEAKFLRLTVTKSVGNFVSAQEMYFHHVPGDSGYLLGDITNDGSLSNDDITSFGNYSGQIKGDSEFEGYVEKGDVNQNGVIDAFDIYYVLNQIGTSKPKALEEKQGTLEWIVDKTDVKAGDTITVTLRGTGLTDVEAINAMFDVDGDKFQLEGDLQLSDTLKSMDENFSRVRTHTDGHKSVNVITANRGGSFAVQAAGPVDLATITLKAKADLSDITIDGRQMMLVGPAEPTLDAAHKDAIKGIIVTSDKKAQAKEELKYLVDRDTNTRYHSDWGTKAVPAQLTFELPEVTDLDRIEYVPRQDNDGGNGTIKTATVEYSTDGQNWTPVEGGIDWTADKQVKTLDLSGITAKFLRITVTDSVNGFVSGQEMYFFATATDTDDTETPGETPEQPGENPEQPGEEPETPGMTEDKFKDKSHELHQQIQDLLDKINGSNTETPDVSVDDDVTSEWVDNDYVDHRDESFINEEWIDHEEDAEIHEEQLDDTEATEIEEAPEDHEQEVNTLETTVKAETTDNTTASQGEQATAETMTDKLPQTGLATAGLGLGVLFTSIGSAFALKKRH